MIHQPIYFLYYPDDPSIKFAKEYYTSLETAQGMRDLVQKYFPSTKVEIITIPYLHTGA